ncbi:MAG: tetratricopeptide repeat protein, partial [Hyphomicrobiales bacterium]|nr:tetratricopeptide repeat protein [Hyphomicrobiales bacterium]
MRFSRRASPRPFQRQSRPRPHSERPRVSARSFKLPARAALAFVAAVVAALPASARESVAVSTPFEVGESPAGNYLAALVAGAERDTLAASTYFREALRADPKNADLTERAFVASLANGNMPEAFGLAERLQKVDRANGLANLALGIRAIKQGRWTAARGLLAKSGAGRQRDLTATLLTAWTYVGSGEPKRALPLIEKLHDDAFSVFRDYHAGLLADVAGQTDEARRRFEAVYKTDKNTLRLVDAYGRFLSSHGDRDKAKQVYSDFDQVVPRHPVVVAALADLAAGKALQPFVRNAEQGAAEVLYGLGAVGGRQGDELAAMIYLRLSLYLEENNALATVTLADVYERLKQNEQAIDVYDSVPENSPLRVNADIQIALLLETMGKADEASKHLKAIVQDHPGDPEAQTALGNVDRSRKDFKGAIEAYTKAIELSKGPEKALWSLYYYRGIAYERDKNWPPAEADFKKALDLYPDQPLVLNYLGYSWVDKGMNLDEAFKMLNRAVELRPQDGYIVDSLGWAHYKLGQYDEAV